MCKIVRMVMPHVGSIDMMVVDEGELQPPPSPTGCHCPDCGAPHSIEDVGIVCLVCHRGIVAEDANCPYCGREPSLQYGPVCRFCGRSMS